MFDLGDGDAVGIVGLSDILSGMRRSGRAATPEVGAELLAAVRARNYVPDVAAALYEVALLRAYEAHCQVQP